MPDRWCWCLAAVLACAGAIAGAQGASRGATPSGMVADSPLSAGFAPATEHAETTCSAQSEQAAIAVLWRQARAGLAAVVAARQATPGRAVILTFERDLGRDGERVEAQRVQLDSGLTSASFQTVPAGVELVSDGFMMEAAGRRSFFGPDADVLLGERFLAGYCLSIAEADSARPIQAGLSFLPRLRAPGRVDLNGVIWLDTAARALREIEFRYLGVHPSLESHRLGGRISFREPRNGKVIVDRWEFRTVPVGGPVRETGGEVARVTWPDGFQWKSSLGALRLRTVDAHGRARSRVPVELAGTTYAGRSNSAGYLEIEDLLPGPYEAGAVDSAFAAIGLPPLGLLRFSAARDSVVSVTLVVQTAEEHMERLCREAGLWTSGSYMVIGRIVAANGRPALGAAWEINDLRRRATRIMPRGMADPATARGVTGSDGLFVYCRALDWGSVVEMRVWRNRSLLRGEPATVAVRTLNKRVTGVRLDLPPDS